VTPGVKNIGDSERGKDSEGGSELAEGIETPLAGVKVVGKGLEASAGRMPGSEMVGVGTGAAVMVGGLNVGRNKARGALLTGAIASDTSRSVVVGPTTGAVDGYCSGGFAP